jgi:hypothetical protein
MRLTSLPAEIVELPGSGQSVRSDQRRHRAETRIECPGLALHLCIGRRGEESAGRNGHIGDRADSHILRREIAGAGTPRKECQSGRTCAIRDRRTGLIAICVVTVGGRDSELRIVWLNRLGRQQTGGGIIKKGAGPSSGVGLRTRRPHIKSHQQHRQDRQRATREHAPATSDNYRPAWIHTACIFMTHLGIRAFDSASD